MKISQFIAYFSNKDAAIQFAHCISKDFFYLVKGNNVFVTHRKIGNIESPLSSADGERLNSIAIKNRNLLRVSY
ncbi:MAG: hypothetical protein J6J60_01095 [Clostridia bacterium]|nr:hypothetical protein [Clostridia bacterium]